MRHLKYAQDLITTSNSFIKSGFNQFINGEKEPKRSDYGSSNQWYAELTGYEYAQKMSEEDGIAFEHGFKCSCGGFAFKYGGSWVCNKCGNKDVNKDWWSVMVEKDGDSYCCHGLDFVNLQESDNCAFGKTYGEALEAYESLMINNVKNKQNGSI